MSKLHRLKQSSLRWMVLAAWVLATLAPTLSHALQWAGGGPGEAPWLELCVSGDPGDGQEPAPGLGGAFKHCAYCVVQPVLGMPGPDADAPKAWAALRHVAPTRAPSAPHARDDTPRVQPRGPPSRA